MTSVKLWYGTGLAACGLALALAAPAAAELYLCKGADGGITYTDNPGTCPESETHEPEADLQLIPTESRPAAPSFDPPPSLRRAAIESAAAESQAQVWRQRMQQKKAELEQVDEQTRALRQYVAHCNRGGELIRRDETGIKHQISCDAVRSEYQTIRTQQAKLRDYVDRGIYEECRRAGCLPGWLR